MPALRALCVMCLCLLLPAQECFPTNLTEHIAVHEGHDLLLKCVGSAAEKADLQWLNPGGFVTFMNNQKVLKDRRYRLAHYSAEELSVTLSNITLGDEGLYTCIYYSHPPRIRRVNVTVLAAPSKPTTESRVHDKEETMVLSCFTSGSKPPPTVTWRIGNIVEIYSDTTHVFEHDRKKCNTTSTLIVRAPTAKSTAECVIRHETLPSGMLTATIDLTPVLRKHYVEMNAAATTLALNAVASESTQGKYTDFLNTITTTTTFQWQTDTEHATTSNRNSISLQSTQEQSHTFGNATPTVEWQPTKTGGTTTNNRSAISLQSTQEQSHTFGNATPTVEWQPTKTGGTTTNNRSAISKGTSPTQVVLTSGQNKETGTYSTDATKNGILLATLVIFLIFSLLFIVQLFMMKLRKAHQIWKKENETSDQTLESNKSRSTNEESQWQNGNIQAPSCKSAICYVNDCSGSQPENLQEAVNPPKCVAQDHVAETTL